MGGLAHFYALDFGLVGAERYELDDQRFIREFGYDLINIDIEVLHQW